MLHILEKHPDHGELEKVHSMIQYWDNKYLIYNNHLLSRFSMLIYLCLYLFAGYKHIVVQRDEITVRNRKSC